MTSDASITNWIEGVKSGDSAACTALWTHCFPELVRHARHHLRHSPNRVADEEDVALSALDSVMRGIQEGRFDELAGSNELMQLLLWITSRKAADVIRRETTQKRGEGRVRGDSALTEPLAGDHCDPVPPDLALSVAEEIQRLLDLLEDDDLQTIALARVDGWTNAEIAGQRQCSVRTIERRLRLIRKIWERES
jgi:DNA-directed RNA polymerase specialized sigma24 family protein